ncbi:hypothetical protein [Alkalihalobacillus trypoxylicola]|uniref:Uncharacterized protein n=1 Tax=Alkalihalobacillus trypoxylicola TaxID=519424 RepID=A0A161PAY8_9BACI|nr:hypothetical protein [Alkalihalobacillus trypoxylicola]KYG29352.1 hypothetical protein AZF04_07450 [Alkalihalobacillus trypoxylicola]
MDFSLKRTHELVSACRQIVNHMEVSGLQEQNLLANIKQQFESCEDVFAQTESEDKILPFVQLKLEELYKQIEELQSYTHQDYLSITNHNIEEYEALSYENQLNQSNVYHAKIDYYSTRKLLHNIEKIFHNMSN